MKIYILITVIVASYMAGVGLDHLNNNMYPRIGSTYRLGDDMKATMVCVVWAVIGLILLFL